MSNVCKISTNLLTYLLINLYVFFEKKNEKKNNLEPAKKMFKKINFFLKMIKYKLYIFNSKQAF